MIVHQGIERKPTTRNNWRSTWPLLTLITVALPSLAQPVSAACVPANDIQFRSKVEIATSIGEAHSVFALLNTTNCPDKQLTGSVFQKDDGLRIQGRPVFGGAFQFEVEILAQATTSESATFCAQILETTVGAPICHRVTFLVQDGVDPDDLIVQDLAARLGLPGEPGNVYLGGLAVNTGGDGGVDTTTSVDLSIDGAAAQTVASCDGPAWSAAGGCPIDLWLNLSPGLRRFTACVDPDQAFSEANEDNNCTTTTISLPGFAPDLIIETLGLQIPGPTVGQANFIQATLANAGNAQAAASVVTIDRGSTMVAEAVPALGPGARHTINMPWTPDQTGLLEVAAWADSGHAIDELDENNNHATKLVSVTAHQLLPDLLIPVNGIALSDDTPEAGQAITFTFSIHNVGDVAADAGIHGIELDIAGATLVSNSCGPSIPAQGSCAATARTVAVAGTQSIWIAADPNGRIAESREDNNSRFHSYFVSDSHSGSVSCAGTWTLTDTTSFESVSAPGHVADNCGVYWGQNTPAGPCWATVGAEGMTASWHRDGGSLCPNRVTVDAGGFGTFEYWISIIPQ